MGDKKECSIASDTGVANILLQKEDDREEDGDEYVSSAHQDNIQGDLMYSTVQTNDNREIPTKDQSNPVVELEDIVKSSNQEYKIMGFPPIDLGDQISNLVSRYIFIFSFPFSSNRTKCKTYMKKIIFDYMLHCTVSMTKPSIYLSILGHGYFLVV